MITSYVQLGELVLQNIDTDDRKSQECRNSPRCFIHMVCLSFLLLPPSHNIVFTFHFSQELRKMEGVLRFHKIIYLSKCLLVIFVLELVFFLFLL